VASDNIEVIADEHGIAVVGEQHTVQRFLRSMDLWNASEEINLKDIGGRAIHAASGVAKHLSEITKHSGRYLKLTPESAALHKRFGLMPTDTPGTSYAMIGERGSINKWLTIEAGSSSVFTNPAVLSGVAGLLTQVAKQHEAQEFRDLLNSIDEKLDDIRRERRNKALAKVTTVARAIQEAHEIRDLGGDTETAWSKVSPLSNDIYDLQHNALQEIETLADRLTTKRSIRSLAKFTADIEQETGVWLAVLARTFELRRQFEVLELQRVARQQPETLDGHRQALEKQSATQRVELAQRTELLLTSIEDAGHIARQNIVLHARAAQHITTALGQVQVTIQQLHRPLGIETCDELQDVMPWRQAIRDKQQVLTAAKDVMKGAGAGLSIAAVGVVGVLGSRILGNDENSTEEAGDLRPGP
jgi:predicted nucleic acid-binding protein